MVFAMPSITNSSDEISRAELYPDVRTFTVGMASRGGAPLEQLATIEQPWAVVNSTSIAGGGLFGWMSAVCWVFGREVFDGLGGSVPMGLISAAWGGSPIEEWSDGAAFLRCNRGDGAGDLYNSVINPYTVGPMALTGFLWYQVSFFCTRETRVPAPPSSPLTTSRNRARATRTPSRWRTTTRACSPQ
jgi:sialate O-acetylesterase